MIINRFALQRVEVQNSLFFMEAFEIMEMDMEFLRKLPTPKELKEQFPVSEKIAAIKEDRDRQIREIFEGKDDRLLLIIGPCSADNEDAVIDYISRLRTVQDKVAEMMKNPAIASVNMNFVCSGEVKVPQNVLNTIKGTKLTVAFHSGNGVALSISGQDLKNKDLSKIQNIDLTVDQTSNTIPANVVSAKSGTVNRQLGIRDTGSFGVNVNIHVNVGKDNSGKSANLYRYNTEKGRLEYCGSFTVTSTGQSMFALKRGGNYLVTVTDRRPSESIWYTEGGYTVKSGDTLSKIAKRNHMTLAQLLRRNVQITNQNVIRVGQKLNLD